MLSAEQKSKRKQFAKELLSLCKQHEVWLIKDEGVIAFWSKQMNEEGFSWAVSMDNLWNLQQKRTK